MRKKLFVFFSILFVFMFLVACGSESSEEGSTLEEIKESGELIAGVKFDTAFFGYQDPETNEIEGFDADLMRLLSEEIFGDEESVEFVQVTSKTRIPLLQNGEIDIAAATLSITDERKEQIDFTESYFMAGQSLLVPEDSSITSVDDLGEEETVIAVKGAVTGDNLKEEVPEVELSLFEDHAQSFAALQSGKGDALTSDNVILLGLADENPGYNLVGDTFTEEPYGLGVQKDDTEWKEFLDEWLEKIKEDGTYDELYDKWFEDL